MNYEQWKQLYDYIFPKDDNVDGFFKRYIKKKELNKDEQQKLLFFIGSLLEEIRDNDYKL